MSGHVGQTNWRHRLAEALEPARTRSVDTVMESFWKPKRESQTPAPVVSLQAHRRSRG